MNETTPYQIAEKEFLVKLKDRNDNSGLHNYIRAGDALVGFRDGWYAREQYAKMHLETFTRIKK